MKTIQAIAVALGLLALAIGCSEDNYYRVSSPEDTTAVVCDSIPAPAETVFVATPPDTLDLEARELECIFELIDAIVPAPHGDELKRRIPLCLDHL